MVGIVYKVIESPNEFHFMLKSDNSKVTTTGDSEDGAEQREFKLVKRDLYLEN
jgi:hypothetical protein